VIGLVLARCFACVAPGTVSRRPSLTLRKFAESCLENGEEAKWIRANKSSDL